MHHDTIPSHLAKKGRSPSASDGTLARRVAGPCAMSPKMLAKIMPMVSATEAEHKANST